MDEKELMTRALVRFAHKKGLVEKYFSLAGWVEHYAKLMERPDSPWVCSGYNNAVSNLDKFRKKHPDIAAWIEKSREYLS